MKSPCNACQIIFQTKKLLRAHQCNASSSSAVDLIGSAYAPLELDTVFFNPQTAIVEIKKSYDIIDLEDKIPGVSGTIRVTPDKKASVFDIIRSFNGAINPRKTWTDIKKNFFEGVTFSYDLYKFPGQGQNKTPVLDSKGVIQLIMVLPGTKAASCRKTFAEIIVRYLGGDLSLCYDVAQTQQQRQITSNKDPDSFIAPIVNNTYTVINKLRNQYNIKPIPLAKLIGLQGIYVASVGVEKDTIVFKYGETDFDVHSRIDRHLGRYKSIGNDDFGPAVIPLYFRETNFSRRVEKDIKRELHYYNLHLNEGHKISDELKGNDELFILREDFQMPQVIDLIDSLIDQYEIQSVEVVDQQKEIRDHEYRMKQLDVERDIALQKTKQLELELEILRLQMQKKSS